jgi:hypothetical protein
MQLLRWQKFLKLLTGEGRNNFIIEWNDEENRAEIPVEEHDNSINQVNIANENVA